MEVQELVKISEKIYSNLQALQPTDIKVIESILSKDTIQYGKIRTFNLEDSQEIILLTLKQNCLILIKYLVENGIDVPNKLLDLVIGLLETRDKVMCSGISQISSTKIMDLQAQMEKERVVNSISNLIIDIVFISKYSSQFLKDFLRSRRVPDDISVNLSIAMSPDLELESFELTVLNKKLIGPVLLSLVKSYKNSLRRRSKAKILEEITPYISGKDKAIVYEIFYLINQDSHKDLLVKIRPESSEEYFGFVSSLIVDRDSAEAAFAKLEPYFDDFEAALRTLLGFSRSEVKIIQPRDEKMIMYLLGCINKLVKYRSLTFYKYISLFQGILKIKIGREIKGIIYEVLCKYMDERDIYIEKIVECRDDIEKEIKAKDFFLLPRLIRFLNAYKKREQREIELLSIGVSIGSPYITETEGSITPGQIHRSSSSDKWDFRILGFKSEDPDTVIECFDACISPEVIKLNSMHIRNAMIKDTRVIEKIIQFQIENKCVIEDISIINVILCFPSPRFFEYVCLFKDFSFYLNGDFLERISDDLDEGIKWICDSYNREMGVFILRNSGYFNEIVRNNKDVQNAIIQVYERILDENLGEAEIRLFENKNNEEESILFLFDDQEFMTEAFFNIFSKQMLYQRFYRGLEKPESILKKKYNSPFYEIYVKTKAVCGLDVSQDIEFLKRSLIATDDILGYLKISELHVPEDNNLLGPSILLNFGIKDSSYVLKNFSSGSDLERFVLFFSIDDVDKDMDTLIKDQIMKNLKTPNKIYLRMCALQLFKCKDLDHIIKILEKNFEDKELLLKLSLHNIMNGGKYFSKDSLNFGDEVLRAKALFLLYYLNIWDKEYLIEIISKLDSDVSDDMRYLVEDIKKH